MKIKSTDELKKIRDQYADKVRLRLNGESGGNRVEILVGMATCGISSGAKETMEAFKEEIGKQGLSNVDVVPVGCIGCCYLEPTIQINIPGQSPVFYGNVKQNNVYDIVEKHIKGGNPVENLLLKVDFERA